MSFWKKTNYFQRDCSVICLDQQRFNDSLSLSLSPSVLGTIFFSVLFFFFFVDSLKITE